MNRITTAALAAAAVVGIAGGTFAATVNVGDGDGQQAGGRPSASQSSSGSPSTSPSGGSDSPESTTTPKKKAGPLYLTAKAVVDGDRTVPVKGLELENVESLERAANGWLVIERTSTQEPAFKATYVDSDGATSPVGEFLGLWDVTGDDTAMVAQFETSYEVREIATGELRQTITPPNEDLTPDGDATFGAESVIAGWRNARGDREVYASGLDDPEKFESAYTDMFAFHSSPGGTLLAGEQVRGDDVSGPSCLAGGPVSDLGGKGWEACDWRTNGLRPQFSPDGGSLLAVPYDTEGFGPTSFAQLSATTGRPAAEFDAPEWVTDAAWAKDGGVLVHGYRDGELRGGIIYRCTLAGKCTKAVTTSGGLVLGKQF